MESVNLRGGVFRCRGRALSLRMSQALLTPSVQRIFLPSPSGPYIPEPHAQKEGGLEREGGTERFPEEDFPVCVCVCFHW